MIDAKDLKDVPFFNSFSDRQLLEIARMTQRRTYRAEAFIYQQGQRAREMYVVEKGLVSLRGLKPADGLVVAFELCEPGDLFGAASLLKDQVYTLTAVCVEECKMLIIDAKKLLKLSETDFELGYLLMKRVAQLYFDRYEAAKAELGVPLPSVPMAPY